MKMSNNDFMEMTLKNDENSSDEELLEYFLSQDIIEKTAKRAIKQRNKCLQNMYYKLKMEQ